MDLLQHIGNKEDSGGGDTSVQGGSSTQDSGIAAQRGAHTSQGSLLKEAWAVLKDLHAPTSVAASLMLDRELSMLRLSENEPVQPVLDKMRELYAKLAIAGITYPEQTKCQAGVSTTTNGSKTFKGLRGDRVLWDLHESRDVFRSMWHIPALIWESTKKELGAVKAGSGVQGECNAVSAAGVTVSARSGETDWETAHRQPTEVESF
ncbi:hypothetical protein CLOM_g1712 [Closterium sp. NIES-68]|nr:hypothetical protein CLOM_g1712 [Closterium sp. NIES-68]